MSLAGTMIARAAISTQSSSPKGGLPPIFVVLICAGFIAISMLSLCMWRKLLSGEAFQPILTHIPIARGQKNDGDPAKNRPEMFDAWAERYTLKNLKWEEYMVSTTPCPVSGGRSSPFMVHHFPFIAFLRDGLERCRSQKCIWTWSGGGKTSGR
ncbi:hypothetical protein H4582DRAFT_1917141 [Lactarius indigo]|nr:hypothetical protein H4582DRAFT_1974992 [Lactarius indigo]KAI9443852.1 hypothetical protein H4582DRAFT_1917141 [Lactarius indigo]